MPNKKSATNQEHRKAMLKKWKEDREKQRLEEKQNSKPIFKVSHVTRSIGLTDLENVNTIIKGKLLSELKSKESNTKKFKPPDNIKPIQLVNNKSSNINKFGVKFNPYVNLGENLPAFEKKIRSPQKDRINKFGKVEKKVKENKIKGNIEVATSSTSKILTKQDLKRRKTSDSSPELTKTANKRMRIEGSELNKKEPKSKNKSNINSTSKIIIKDSKENGNSSNYNLRINPTPSTRQMLINRIFNVQTKDEQLNRLKDQNKARIQDSLKSPELIKNKIYLDAPKMETNQTKLKRRRISSASSTNSVTTTNKKMKTNMAAVNAKEANQQRTLKDKNKIQVNKLAKLTKNKGTSPQKTILKKQVGDALPSKQIDTVCSVPHPAMTTDNNNSSSAVESVAENMFKNVQTSKFIDGYCPTLPTEFIPIPLELRNSHRCPLDVMEISETGEISFNFDSDTSEDAMVFKNQRSIVQDSQNNNSKYSHTALSSTCIQCDISHISPPVVMQKSFKQGTKICSIKKLSSKGTPALPSKKFKSSAVDTRSNFSRTSQDISDLYKSAQSELNESDSIYFSANSSTPNPKKFFQD